MKKILRLREASVVIFMPFHLYKAVELSALDALKRFAGIHDPQWFKPLYMPATPPCHCRKNSCRYVIEVGNAAQIDDERLSISQPQDLRPEQMRCLLAHHARHGDNRFTRVGILAYLYVALVHTVPLSVCILHNALMRSNGQS